MLVPFSPVAYADQAFDRLKGNNYVEKLSDHIKAEEKIEAGVKQQFESDKYVTYLVKMVEQVDTEKVAAQAQTLLGAKATPAKVQLAKAEAVVNALSETSLRTQLSLTKYLEKMQQTGEVQKYKSFYIVNALSVTSTKEVMEKIASFPEVEKILPNRTHSLVVVQDQSENKVAPPQLNSIEWNIQQVSAPQVWELGIDGTGIVVANMDTGVQLSHPALQHKWRGHDVADPSLSWFDPFTSSTTPIDGHGHGTHTMGIMVGSEQNGSNQIGVAPGAKWIAARVFDSSGSTTDEILLEGGEWILAPKDSQGNPHPEMAPRVVNNSWGDVVGTDEWFRPMVQAWRSAGIFPVFSAGNVYIPYNYGGPGSIPSPASYPESFSVAAVDSNNKLASWSLRGPTQYGVLKPEISAPGVEIRSSVPSGGYESAGWSGTSFASPHVAGAVALLLQANSSLSIEEVESVLRHTATPLTDQEYTQSPNYGYGYGLLNAYAAVLQVAEGYGRVSGAVSIPGDDTEAPILSHTPVTEAFMGYSIPLTIQIMDNVSIISVKGFARVVGDEDWVEFPLTRISGDHTSASYMGEIPAEILDVAGIEYYFTAMDFGNNVTTTNIYTISIYSGIKPGYFQDFENNALGFVSTGTNNTWEWGVPTSGPNGAYSGEKLIATNLSGNYLSSSNSSMIMPPIDLTDVHDAAYLTFMHWYDLENNYDKGYVYLTTDLSSNQFTKALEITGSSNGWKMQFIDLSDYLGEIVYLMFNLQTDGSVVRAGWYIDDIALFGIDDVAPSAPTNVRISANALGTVTLSWDASVDIDVKDYMIYRSTTAGTGYEFIGSTTATEYSDQVSTGTYYYIVKTRDYSNNVSDASEEVSITVVAPEILFYENFDGDDDNGWTHDGSLWQRGVPTSGPSTVPSPPNVWATNLSGNYTNSANNSLVSPMIDLSNVQQAVLTFNHWYEIETNYDYGYVEVKRNEGSTWEMLTRFSDSNNGKQWEQVVLDLTPYVGGEVQVRFRLTSDSSVTKFGWYIDDFRILATSAEVTTYSDPYVESVKPKFVESAPQVNMVDIVRLDQTIADVAQLSPRLNALPIGATITVVETGISTSSDPGTGRYSLIHPAGSYTVRAEAYGYYTSEQSVTIVSNEEAIMNFQLDPIPTGTVYGTVTDQRTGEPIEGVTLLLSDPRIPPQKTDENGLFSITVIGGDYLLTAFVEGYERIVIPIRIVQNETQQLHIELVPMVGLFDEIAYDDGSIEDAVVLNVSGGFAVRMTPAYENAQVVGAMFRFYNSSWPNPGGTAFKYAIYDVNASDGLPGNLIAGPFDGTAKRDDTWTHVQFEQPVSVQGDFYLVYIQVGINPNAPGIGLDNTSPNSYRNFMLANNVWSPLDPTYGNLMMRALMYYPSGAPVITSPADGTFTNVAEVTVTGTADFDESLIRLYNGQQLIGTTVVENNQFSIDVTLNEGENLLFAEAVVNGKTTERSDVVSIVLDQTLPQIIVTSHTDGEIVTEPVITIEGTVYEDHLESLLLNEETVTVNSDGTFMHPVVLTTGDNLITLQARDRAGNVAEYSLTLTLEGGAFTLTNVQPEEDVTLRAGDELVVSFESVEELTAEFRVELNLDSQLNRTGIPMTEVSPGYYEGRWVIPEGQVVTNAYIVLYVRDDEGHEMVTVTPGRLTIVGESAPSDGTNVWVRVDPAKVNVNEPFTVSIQFSNVEDLYAAQFTLIYDEQLEVTNVDHFVPNHITSWNRESIGSGKVKLDYVASFIGDRKGYSGDGAMAMIHFVSDTSGTFDLELTNVRFLNSEGEDIEIDAVLSGAVTIEVPDREDPSHILITGVIDAEAFGEEVNYDEVWYEGDDGVHRIIVEALNEQGEVVKIGKVKSDGSYIISVPPGNYTIRVKVPGHFSGQAQIAAGEDVVHHFGPLTAGDVNGDQVINLYDLLLAAKAYGKNLSSFDYKSSAADLNRDGVVDLLDLSFILNNFGRVND